VSLEDRLRRAEEGWEAALRCWDETAERAAAAEQVNEKLIDMMTNLLLNFGNHVSLISGRDVHKARALLRELKARDE
jgi:hypothetical protein